MWNAIKASDRAAIRWMSAEVRTRLRSGLGVMSRLQDAATRVRELIFVDDAGRRVASMRTRQREDREVEVPRADLSAILVEAGRGDAEFLFDEMITQLRPGRRWRRCDLRPGRLHAGLTWWSGQMAFTLESAAWPSGRKPTSYEHLGMYVATAKLGIPLERDDVVIMHNEPGTAVALHPGAGSPGVAFMFRSRARIDHRDSDARPTAAEADVSQWRLAYGGTAVCLPCC